MLKRVAKIIGISVLVIIGLFVLLIVRGIINENATKKLLADEVAYVKPPPSCTESKREYVSGGLDVASTWVINYSCNTTGKAAYDFIISELSQGGYNEISDYSKGDGNLFYSFTYASDKIEAGYEFNGINGQTYPVGEQSPLTSIHLELSRATATYN